MTRLEPGQDYDRGERKFVFANAKVAGVQVCPDEYHKQDPKRGDMGYRMSRSDLMSFALCPSRWRQGYESPESDAKANGTLIDCMVLDSGRFHEKYAVAPETYTNEKGERKAWNFNANVCKAWREEQGDREVIKAEEHAEAKAAVKALSDCEPAFELLNCSTKQVLVTAEYNDRETGLTIPVKTLIDLVPLANNPTFGKCLGDFKTGRSGNPSKWDNEVFTYNYDAQASLVLDLFVAATGNDRNSFVHILQENVSPYHVVTPLPLLSVEFIELGRTKYLEALKFYAQCLKNDQWPSYRSTRTVIEPFQIISPRPYHLLALADIIRELSQPEEERQPEPVGMAD